MRLIDADEIIKQFDPNTWQGEMMIAIAKGLPTAYDVDKVVEQLKTRRYEEDRNIENFGSAGSYIAYCNGLNDAENIVKGGGKNE